MCLFNCCLNHIEPVPVPGVTPARPHYIFPFQTKQRICVFYQSVFRHQTHTCPVSKYPVSQTLKSLFVLYDCMIRYSPSLPAVVQRNFADLIQLSVLAYRYVPVHEFRIFLIVPACQFRQTTASGVATGTRVCM